MPHKVIRRYMKTPEQDWSGIYYNVSKSMNQTADPRDAQFNTDSDLKLRSRALTEETRSNFSNYIGSERVYENEHCLAIKYYFNSLEDAKSFFLSFQLANTAAKAIVELHEEKHKQNIWPSYTIQTSILDDDDNVVLQTSPV